MSVTIPETSGATTEQIELAERQLGCELPEVWREFARRYDGARPADNIIAVPGNETGVRAFVPVLEAAACRDGIEGFPIHAVPIAEDGCGNYFWLDPTSGEVFFWDHEVEELTAPVAADFSLFLMQLRPFDASSVRLAPGQVRAVWVDPDFKPEFD